VATAWINVTANFDGRAHGNSGGGAAPALWQRTAEPIVASPENGAASTVAAGTIQWHELRWKGGTDTFLTDRPTRDNKATKHGQTPPVALQITGVFATVFAVRAQC
jgi:hypothetical protein